MNWIENENQMIQYWSLYLLNKTEDNENDENQWEWIKSNQIDHCTFT